MPFMIETHVASLLYTSSTMSLICCGLTQTKIISALVFLCSWSIRCVVLVSIVRWIFSCVCDSMVFPNADHILP